MKTAIKCECKQAVITHNPKFSSVQSSLSQCYLSSRAVPLSSTRCRGIDASCCVKFLLGMRSITRSGRTSRERGTPGGNI
eukprot:scaffold359428_cov41-Prasinocladus_malaysianus.AAC.1